ncbi:MAG: hypothetical protein HY324_02495 [Chlamydiia bacterium]|nr:hypothetical protein [Chlamydiia bacterium]
MHQHEAAILGARIKTLMSEGEMIKRAEAISSDLIEQLKALAPASRVQESVASFGNGALLLGSGKK